MTLAQSIQPTYSPDPQRPLGNIGHHDLYINDRDIDRLNRAGFVVVKATDYDALRDKAWRYDEVSK